MRSGAFCNNADEPDLAGDASATLGICRMFFNAITRHLPDGRSAFAGCFSHRHRTIDGFPPPRRTSARDGLQSVYQSILVKAKEGGLRPAAFEVTMKRNRTAGAARTKTIHSGRRETASQSAFRRREEFAGRGAERSPSAAKTKRGVARGTRPTTRLRTAENPPHDEGHASPASAATGGLFDSLALRDRRGSIPPVAAASRPATLPARHRPFGRIHRGADDTTARSRGRLEPRFGDGRASFGVNGRLGGSDRSTRELVRHAGNSQLPEALLACDSVCSLQCQQRSKERGMGYTVADPSVRLARGGRSFECCGHPDRGWRAGRGCDGDHSRIGRPSRHPV